MLRVYVGHLRSEVGAPNMWVFRPFEGLKGAFKRTYREYGRYIRIPGVRSHTRLRGLFKLPSILVRTPFFIINALSQRLWLPQELPNIPWVIHSLGPSNEYHLEPPSKAPDP